MEYREERKQTVKEGMDTEEAKTRDRKSWKSIINCLTLHKTMGRADGEQMMAMMMQ